MAIRNLIEQIAAGWSTYRQKVRVDRNDPIYALVVKQFPEALQHHVAAFDTITLEGSTGARQHNCCPLDCALRSAAHRQRDQRFLRCLSLLYRLVSGHTQPGLRNYAI